MINNKIFEITKDEPIKPNQESINNFKSIYKSSGFFLLKDSIINQNEINLNIDLDEIKQYDNSLGKTNIYEKGKKKLNSKENFIKDSFYSEILSTNEKLNKFKNLHNSTNFKLLQNEDKSNSSIYFNYLIINNLENDKEIKNIESNLYTLINSITDYKKENISIISRQYKYDEWVFVSDDKVATVGTLNLDYRSLYTHFECGNYIYNASVIADIKDDTDETIKKSHKVALNELKHGFFKEVFQSMLRIFAPLL